MSIKIGFLTIGQSPRVDVLADLSSMLEDEFEVVEAGALDTLSRKEISELAPRRGETLYVSRLRNGKMVELSKERIIPLLNERIAFLEGLGVKCIGLLCSGVFHKLSSKVPLIRPEPSMRGIVESVLDEGSVLGIIMPSSHQIALGKKKWSTLSCRDIIIDSVSPYSGDKISNIRRLALKFMSLNVNLVVMDCIGFSMNDMAAFKTIYNVPVVLARSALAMTIKTLYGKSIISI